MRTTIGELISEILPFSRSLEMDKVESFPLIKASIGRKSGCTASIIYVMQVEEGLYSVCETDDDLHGYEIIPVPSRYRPFIREKEVIKAWLKKYEQEGDENVRLNIDKHEFIKWMLELLKGQKLLKASRQILELPLSKFGFKSKKISRQLSTLCKIKEYDTCLIQDIILMMKELEKIHLKNFKKDDVQDIYNKFKQHGIILDIQDDIIRNITLELRGGF